MSFNQYCSKFVLFQITSTQKSEHVGRQKRSLIPWNTSSVWSSLLAEILFEKTPSRGVDVIDVNTSFSSETCNRKEKIHCNKYCSAILQENIAHLTYPPGHSLLLLFWYLNHILQSIPIITTAQNYLDHTWQSAIIGASHWRQLIDRSRRSITRRTTRSFEMMTINEIMR